MKFMFPLYMPVDTIGEVSSGTKESKTAEDDLKFLREVPAEGKVVEQEEEPEESEEEEKPEEEEPQIEEDKEEEEEEEEEEPEDEKEIIGALVTAKDLKEKYPDIFKKVPELKGVIYREQQYSQIFADPKEAQQAAQQANTFIAMESDLLNGNTEPLFKALKDGKGGDFNKLVSGLLPTLRKIDEPTYMKMLAVPFKQVLRSALAEGTKSGDKNLTLSAQHLHNFIFGDTNLDGKVDFENVDTKKPKAQEEYEKKLAELDERDHKAFKVSVDTDWLDKVKEAFFDRFDPDNTISKWTKNKMYEEAVAEINKQLSSDPRHMKNMQALWNQARASGYNLESKSRIVNAALARAKQVLPTVRTKLRADAFAKGEKSEKSEKRTMKVVSRSEGKKPEQKRSLKSTEQMSDLDIIRG